MAPRSPSAPASGSCASAAARISFTDVVFAGVFMFLVVWTLHGMIYRWWTRAEEGVIERGLAQIGEALRGALAGLAGWITGRVGRGS